MKKIKLYIACSINGLIARPNGNVDWLESMPNPNKEDYGYFDFYKSCDTTVMGNNTYQFILDSGHDFPYVQSDNYVLTRDDSRIDNDNVRFISKDIIPFIQSLKQSGGKDIWLIGGSQINSLLMEQQLVDELWLYVMPIILEDGIPIFKTPVNESYMILTGSKTYSNGVVELKYRLKTKDIKSPS